MKNILSIGIFIILVSSCSNKLVYNSVNNQAKCSERGGYWYKNKCWKDFDDEDGISNSEIDAFVVEEMKIIKQTTILFDNTTYPLTGLFPVEEEDRTGLITVYGTKDNYKTLIFPIESKNIENGIFETSALFFNGDAISNTMDEESRLNGTATINIVDLENLVFEINGEILSKENSIQKFSFKTNEALTGAGNSNLEIKGNEAYLSGSLGTITYSQIKDLIKNHPKIKTIVMTHISGSINDAVNMHTGRLLRKNGFTTKVLSNSDIASGGVDLFCAGKKRIVEKGAKIGVHSWCCINSITAIEAPKEHPAHKYQLEYFTMALGIDKGPAFYFYTLEAATFDNIHYMTNDEIKDWGIATEFIED